MALKFLNLSIPKISYSNSTFLILILGIFFFLRLWILPQTIPFGWDQERDAFTVKSIISLTNIPLIGPRVVGDNGFFLGPYFFYILTPFYFITGSHPYAIIIFLVFFSLLFFIISYKYLKTTFNVKTSLIFLFLWTIIPATLNQDRIAWNPFLIPLGFFVLMYFLSRYKSNILSPLILGLILGLIFNLHFQGIFYLFFVLIYFINKRPGLLSSTFIAFIGFCITFLPLLIFDLRHQGINFHLFYNFFFSSSVINHSITAFLPVWSNFVKQIIGFGNIFTSIIFYLLLLIYGLVNHKKLFFRSASFILILTPIVFALYGRRPSEYYFNYLLPIILIYFAHFISNLNVNKYILVLFFSFFCINSFLSLKTNPLSLFYKIDIVKNAKLIVKSNPVYITYDTPIGENNGFDYLIQYYKINRSTDTTRPMIQFVIPRRESLISSGNISLVLPPILN
jgi:4-amino-4-deoxy-L-arabinose transferase-like glycosyltransferase